MSEEIKLKVNFIEAELARLIKAQPILKGQKIVRCSAVAKTHLDGFMSSIFTVKLFVKSEATEM